MKTLKFISTHETYSMSSSLKGEPSRTTSFTVRQYSVACVWLNVPTGWKQINLNVTDSAYASYTRSLGRCMVAQYVGVCLDVWRILWQAGGSFHNYSPVNLDEVCLFVCLFLSSGMNDRRAKVWVMVGGPDCFALWIHYFITL